MTKQEKNEAIAKILGFEKYGIKVNGVPDAVFAWTYPNEFKYLVAGHPTWNVPDFIEQLEDRRKIQTIIRGWE